MATQYIRYPTSGGVTSINTLTGAITLAAGTGITLTPAGNTITIAATGTPSFPLEAPNGTAAAPSYAFGGDTGGAGTGLYAAGVNILGFASNGVTAGNISAAQRWTVGSAVTPATHIFNGALNIQSTGTSSQPILVNGVTTNAGVSHFGISSQSTLSSAQTTAGNGFYSLLTTAASTTMQFVRGYEADGFTKGAGGTVTNYIDFGSSGNNRNATNNAVVANTTTFTGDYFLFQNGSDESLLGGNLRLNTVGKGLLIKEGSNAKMGVATLSTGTVVVSTTAVTATSRIFLTAQSLGTVTVGQGLAISARSAGTSFTILSTSPTDTSVVAWMIIEPA